ncbi:MAG: 50S ribosomal protein L30 [Dehalococcoidia bacterium]
MTVLNVTYCKSAIGYNQSQKDTIRALGFRRLGQTVSHDDSSSLRGMIRRVSHLVEVEEVES